MTKSEAKAIFESTSRVLRALQGIESSAFYGDKSMQERAEAYRNHVAPIADEVQRVYDMAAAELGK